MQRFKHLIQFALGFTAALTLVELLLILTAGHTPERSIWPTPQAAIKHFLASDGADPSVLFFGSSITEASIDPDHVGNADGFNAALPFSTPTSSEVWYRQENGFSTSAEVVILGIPPWPQQMETGPGWLGPALNSAYEYQAGWLDRFALHRHEGVLADWFDLRHFQLGLGARVWKENGHHVGYYPHEDDEPTIQLLGPDLERLTKEDEDAIRRMEHLTDVNGAQLVLLIEPASEDFMEQFDSEATEAYHNSIEDLGKELGVPVWDTYSIPWQTELFADGVHFNYDGTVEYSAFISRELAKCCAPG